MGKQKRNKDGTIAQKKGRKPVKIDKKLVANLASIGCTWEEISEMTGNSLGTLKRRCATEKSKGEAHLKMSIRRELKTKLDEGNVKVLLHLAQYYLGMKIEKDEGSLHQNLNIYVHYAKKKARKSVENKETKTIEGDENG